MSKIVAFYGSPRAGGNTAALVNRAVAGAKSAGAQVVAFDLNEDGVKGCKGCLYCRANEGCSTDDKLKPMYKEIKEAAGIIAGFPIYFMDIGAQSKILIDRLFPMLAGDFSPKVPGKKFAAFYSQGQPDKTLYANAIEKNNMVLSGFGWDLAGCLLCYGGIDPAYAIPQETLDGAFEIGKRLAQGAG